MNQFSNNPKPLSCSDTSELIEKEIVEEILTPQEKKRLNQHFETCEVCRNLYKITFGLPVLANASDEGQFDAPIAEVMKTLAKQRLNQRNQKFKIAALALAAIAAIALAVNILRESPDEKQSPFHLADQCIPTIPQELAPGVLAIWCRDKSPETIVKEDSVTISLTQGALVVSADPMRSVKKQISVLTPAFDILVKGTIFSVSIENKKASVEVLRGLVEIIPHQKGLESTWVSQGYGIKTEQFSTYELIKPINQDLLEQLAQYPEQESSISLKSEPDHPSKTLSTMPVKIDSSDVYAKAQEKIKKITASKNQFQKTAIPTMEELLEDARSCLLQHNWNCAANKYEQVLNDYPEKKETTAILISLAKIQLRHQNFPRKALINYQQYLQKAPVGPLAEEALMGIADCYKKLGQTSKEITSLRLFLEKHPKSALLKQAHSRLEKLESNK